MNVPPPLWPEISALLDEALALLPQQRTAWLAQAGAAHPTCAPYLRQMLDALATDTTNDLPGQSGDLFSSALQPTRNLLQPNRLVGPYKLLHCIGQGGMASVWLADQTQPMRRRVALKIAHGQLTADEGSRQRFEQERDLLASLEHPNIARLYDAGVDDDGTPYLAMEWVDGLPLVAWCDARDLTVRSRLVLFLQVLRAVSQAHSQLIIHRDIKSSNILVAEDGTVKLLDFGIARLLNSALPDGGSWAMTPDSASPEQLAGQPLGTPTDLYSLGVVLYELLARRRPYRLIGAATELADERARQLIAAPSTCALAVGDAAGTAARTRAWRRELAGDLDAIVSKAMQPEPALRYDSQAALMADLQRHLDHWPVQARQPTRIYRLRTFARRHRIAVWAMGVSALALSLGTGVALWQADRALAQARRAQAVQTFLTRLFEASDPQQAQGRDRTVKSLLDDGARQVVEGFSDQPGLRAELQHRLGMIYIALGDNAAARPHIEQALQHYALSGEQDTEAAVQTRFQLLEIQVEQGQFEAAASSAERVLTLGRALAGEGHRWALPTQRLQAWMLIEQGRADQAAQDLGAALAQSARRGTDPPVQTLMARSTLATAEQALGQLAKARDNFSAVITQSSQVSGYPIVNQLPDRYNLARAQFLLGEFAPAATQLEDLVPQMDRALGARHDRTIKARALLAQALAETGQIERAVQTQRFNLEHARRTTGLASDVLALQLLTLAKLSKAAGLYAEGVASAKQGLAALGAPPAHATWISERGRWVLGDNLIGAGNLSLGLETLQSAVDRARALPAYASQSAWADMLQSLALAEARSAKPANGPRLGTALATLQTALSIYESSHGSQSAAFLRCAAQLAWLRAISGHATGGEDFERAAQAYVGATGGRPIIVADLAWMRSELALRSGQAGAALARRQAAQAMQAALGEQASVEFVGLH